MFLTREQFEKMQVVKDLGIVLKDFEPMVKDPKWLWSGRRIENFNLLPREAWGNWLVSVVLRKMQNRNITFADSEDGDGFIVDKTIKSIFPTEHVSALDIPKGKKWAKGEQRAIEAINLNFSYLCLEFHFRIYSSSYDTFPCVYMGLSSCYL